MFSSPAPQAASAGLFSGPDKCCCESPAAHRLLLATPVRAEGGRGSDPSIAALFEEEVVMIGEVDEIGLDVDRSHLQTASCLTVLPGPTRDRQLGLGVITEWP